MADEVTERVRKTISSILKVPVERVQGPANLIRDLGMESIKSVELIAALEEEFDIEIDADSIGEVVTVQKSIDYVKAAL